MIQNKQNGSPPEILFRTSSILIIWCSLTKIWLFIHVKMAYFTQRYSSFLIMKASLYFFEFLLFKNIQKNLNLWYLFSITDVLLPSGSEEEVEIRGCSIHAVELVKKRIKERIGSREDVEVPNSSLIDYYLWCYRRKHADELEKVPFHKTFGIFY